MKLKEGFLIRELADSYVVVSVDQKKNGFHGMIQLNKTGAFLWSQLQKVHTREALVCAVLEQYDATKEEAEENVDRFIQTLKKAGILCE